MQAMRMNLFQRLTMQWDQLHPYNAAQIMRIDSSASCHEIAACWQAALRALGLGRIRVKGASYEHIAAGSPLIQLGEAANLETFAAAQMNTPFDLAVEGPFRAFVLPSGNTPIIGIVYHHWVADSVSIRVLMRDWFQRIMGRPARITRVPFIPGPSQWVFLQRLPQVVSTFLGWRRKHRFVRRLHPAAMRDLSVGWRAVSLPDQTAMRLLAAAHEHDVKVTDLLMCSIAQVADRYLPAGMRRRPDILLGEIRDLRLRMDLADPDAFGAALAMSSVICGHDLLGDRLRLLQHIAAENRKVRSKPADQAVSAWVALAAGRMLSQRRLLGFYRKRLPVAAGLSNVDLTSAIAAFGDRDRVLDYWRISPTGPITPLAIAPTTMGAKFNVSLTWRQSLFSAEATDGFLNEFIDAICAWNPQTQELRQVYEPAA